MQTFLPFPDFAHSVRVLDNKRLGKQRVECLQLLRGQWTNHPASKMWRGHEYALASYGVAVCDEWLSRGFKDTCREKILAERARFVDTGLPSWFGDESFHCAHRSNLLRKSRVHYENFFNDVDDTLPYVWPSPA